MVTALHMTLPRPILFPRGAAWLSLKQGVSLNAQQLN
jgi:hypothetical protein